MMRQPIVAIMGHVDHGKTLVLDKIRGTAVAAKEHGGITQAIGASIIPIDTIKKVCGDLLGSMNVTIPGLLFVDTPGHAAFNSLRKRGGNLADIAILVVDCREGFKPQTIESIEILKAFKTPFIIAANKIDLISGWRPEPGKSVLKKIAEQTDQVQQELDKKLYELVGKVYEFGLEAERFDRVNDYTKQIAIVPTSAVTGDGIPELLMVLTGLAQKFLEKNLEVDLKSAAKGTVLEVKEETGLGKTMDTIIYNGSLNVGDTLVVGGMNGPIAAKVKALFLPAPLAEMREKRTKFKSVKEVHAANGVKIVAPGTEDVVSGMPVLGAGDDVEKAKEIVQAEVKEVLTEPTSKEGIMIKADSLGSLEALAVLLKEKDIPIQKASVGVITKRDISDAEANYEKDPLRAVILGFNIPMPESVPANVKIITHPVIYKVIEDYEDWVEKTKKEMELAAMGVLTKPAKVKILKGYTFRQSNPAVVGVEIITGTLMNNIQLMNPDGKVLTKLRGMQLEQKNIESADRGKQVAISLPDVTVGRQIKEGDILYSFISEEDFKKFKEYKQYLSDEEKDLLKEIAEIMRRNNPVWGV
ncbi:translation initiation factor IF-2 [Candidatus Woesearchaeota archaeon]|nr:translation initiation factor IF-2 [Candidatus Woesearchaeota archaeon]